MGNNNWSRPPDKRQQQQRQQKQSQRNPSTFAGPQTWGNGFRQGPDSSPNSSFTGLQGWGPGPQSEPGTGPGVGASPMTPFPGGPARRTGPIAPPASSSRPLMPGPAGPNTPMPFASPSYRPVKPKSDRWMIFALALSAVLIVASVILYIAQQQEPGQSSTATTPRGNSTQGNTTQQPGATPTASEHRRYQQLAAQYVAKMSLEDMIAQLIFVNDNADETTQDELDYMIQTQHIGGVLLYWNRILTKEQVQSDIQKWAGETQTPLFVATEDEGGYVDRLSNIYERQPSAQEIAANGDPTEATSEGTLMAQHLKELNINTTFTPVVDVAVQKDGYLDWDERSFGYTPDEVIKYAGPYLAAMQKEGIIGSTKHFPGSLGRIARDDDPHGTLPTVSATKEEMYQIDMVPFKHFIQSQDAYEHPGFVMTTYVAVPSLDPSGVPAQYSSIIVNDILREEFGYDGVVITDALVMQGSQINGKVLTMAEGTVLALKAGNDMLLGAISSSQVQETIDAVEQATQNGELTEERIKESATRVITLKLERKLLSEQQVQG
jgi:beta-N-acetylhexosaminidase